MSDADYERTWVPISTTIVDLSGVAKASGLSGETAMWAKMLVDEYEAHVAHNSKLRRYYEGNVAVSDYGVTAGIENDQSCFWPSKAVDALADRITLERFNMPEGLDEHVTSAAGAVQLRNAMVTSYNRHIAPKLIYGCMGATVTRNHANDAVVRFHSAETFTAIPSPDGRDGVVAAGLAIARREHTQWSHGKLVPTMVNLHLPGNVVQVRQVAAGEWVAEDGYTREGEPSLYVFSHDSKGTLNPFGRTRITRFVRDLTKDAIRCMWHMQISGTYYSMPKLLMLNLTSEQYDAVTADKLKYQLDRVLATEMDEMGEGRTAIQQLSGNSPQPFVDELMALAKQFSGATGIPLNSLGIVQDNPSSAQAIEANREDICLIARRDIEEDKPVLRRLMQAAISVQANTTIAELPDETYRIMPKFTDPMIFSREAMADWATKVNSIRPGFGGTDVAARMMGIDDADLESVKSDETKAAAAAMAAQLFGGSNG